MLLNVIPTEKKEMNNMIIKNVGKKIIGNQTFRLLPGKAMEVKGDELWVKDYMREGKLEEVKPVKKLEPEKPEETKEPEPEKPEETKESEPEKPEETKESEEKGSNNRKKPKQE